MADLQFGVKFQNMQMSMVLVLCAGLMTETEPANHPNACEQVLIDMSHEIDRRLTIHHSWCVA